MSRLLELAFSYHQHISGRIEDSVVDRHGVNSELYRRLHRPRVLITRNMSSPCMDPPGDAQL